MTDNEANTTLAQAEPEDPTGNQAITRALIAVSGGLCYFTADAKHAQLLTVQKILLEALRPEPEGVTDEEEWYPGFADWLEREMPEGTVISDPLWWASKIADYLQRHARPTIKPVAYLRRQGNYTEASEFSLSEEEKARGWTEEPLYIHHALPVLGAEVG
jgi:hypothetical protein